MDNKTNLDNLLSSSPVLPRSGTQNLITGVFSWMFLALCISAIISYVVSSNPMFSSLISDSLTGRMTSAGMVISLLPFGLVLLMSFGYQKLSFPLLALVFIIYATLMGISLSTIFLVYTATSLASTFAITAVTFGVMAVTGYTTKTDLTKFGGILIMALIGIIVASIVNFFLHSDGLYYLISFAGVAIFTGLTAYDVQKIKNLSLEAETNGWDTQKLTIMGALTLYLDFVNLFLFLLRLFGGRRR